MSTQTMNHRVFLGRDSTASSDVQIATMNNWAIGISPGIKSPAPKVDPNEDAVSVIHTSGGVVAVVADAHCGRLSAEETVNHVIATALKDPPQLDPAQWMRACLTRSEETTSRRFAPSACAALLVIQRKDRLWWSSVGDCRLYVVQGKQTTILNTLNHRWLGNGGGAMPEEGSTLLTPSTRIVLASDGLPECVYGKETLFPVDVGRAARSGSAGRSAHALIQAALTGGGQDNVAIAIGVL